MKWNFSEKISQILAKIFERTCVFGKFIKFKQIWPLFIWVIAVAGFFVYLNYYPNGNIFNSSIVEKYSLVADKISQSAPIAIHLPEKGNKQAFQAGIKFSPELKGEWLASTNEQELLFKPIEKLKIGNYYSVEASTTIGILKKDFLVDEDPKVLSAFPVRDVEASEKTDITIMFNRPIVALSTLDNMKAEVPVELQPATAGRWHWLSPRTLQFTPENGLIPSAHYEVKIKNLISVDKLTVPEFSYKFITRPLRYIDFEINQVSYKDSIALRFNQSVDLEKTKAEINLMASSSGEKINFIAEYGVKDVWDEQSKKNKSQEDKSTINIYLAKDKFGREKYWNFDTDYKLNIKKAYPYGGDIELLESKNIFFRSSGLLQSVTAESSRSMAVEQNLFDPTGSLTLSFFEDIDLPRSQIYADKLIKIEYVQKCKDAGVEIGADVECDKTDDKTKVKISLVNQDLSVGETLHLHLETVINTAGIKINTESTPVDVKSYGLLQIINTFPKESESKASLTEMVACSNNPLTPPASEDYKKNIKANIDFEIKNWNNSFRISASDDRANVKCQVGEFETHINLGLQPESDYSLNILAQDDFGQETNFTRSFRTGTMPENFLNFYHYQNYYSVTSPDKTRLAFAGENMEYVDVNVCRLSAENMLYYLNNKPDYWKGPSAVSGCVETKTARIELPKKYWIKNYFRFDLKDYISKPLGHYILTFTNHNYYDRSQPRKRVYERTYLSVTNMSVVEKREEIYNDGKSDTDFTVKQQASVKNLYWVTNLKDLQPISGVDISLFGGDSIKNAKSAGAYKTNEQGIAETKPVNKMYGIIARSGNDSAIVSDVIDKLEFGSGAYNAQSIYMYTDRPLYRPGHTVDFKGIYRIGFDGNYEIFRDKKIPVKIFDAQNKEIYSKELEVNEFGTFNDEFILPTQAPLGSYRIEAKNSGYAYFDVEEYKGAAFKVETKTDKEEHVAGDNFTMNIDASYYFGAPVDGGDVEYSITSQDYYFDKYQDEYFSFGQAWYDCSIDCYFGDKFLLRDKTKLDKSGKGNISRQLDFNKLFKNANERGSKLITVFSTVKNLQGQTVSSQQSFIVHSGDYYLGIKSDNSFIGKNKVFKLRTKSVDVTGKPLSVSNLNLKINRIKWVYAKRQEVDGGYYYQWDRRLEQVDAKTINTDSKGDWSGDFMLDKEGEYEVSLTGNDSKGNIISSAYEIYVYGGGQVEVKPNNDTSLDLVAEKSDIKVGETASIIIKSPYKKAKALISVERGKIYEYHVVDIIDSLYKFDFKVTEQYIPSVYVSVTLLSDKPEVKYGSTYFTVNAKEKQLNISVKTNKDFYLPGEEVALDFSVSNSSGQPVAAEFSAAVVDLSVLALKGNPKKEPVMFFYGGFPLTVSTISNLRNILFEADIPIGTKGGGGNNPEDLARKKRGVFRDTAFWQANIRSDASGKAQVKFILPDNLTTWQLETVGVTTDTRLGTNYKEFISQKDIMAVPLVPRFVVPGDKFAAGAKIYNRTDKSQKLKISFFSGTLQVSGDMEKEIEIPAKDSKMIYFDITTPKEKMATHAYSIKAENEIYKDEVLGKIAGSRDEIYELTALTADSQGDSQEYLYLPTEVAVDRGDVSITTSPSLMSFMPGSVKNVLSAQYDDNLTLINKLEVLSAVKRLSANKTVASKFDSDNVSFEGQNLTADQFVSIALSRLFGNFSSEGLTYYPNGVPDIYLTIKLAICLADLRQSGYKIDDVFAANVFANLNGRIKNNEWLQSDKDTQILLAYGLFRLKSYGTVDKDLVDKIKSLDKDANFMQEKIGNLSLIYLIKLLQNESDIFGKAYLEKSLHNLENRVNIDSRGAFVSGNTNLNWQFFETTEVDTSLALSALTNGGRTFSLAINMERWLMSNKGQDGYWGSVNNSSIIIDSLSSRLNASAKDINYSLQISLNGVPEQTFAYAPTDIFRSDELSWSLNKLTKNIVNIIGFHETLMGDTPNKYYYDVSMKYYPSLQNLPAIDEGFTVERNFYTLDDKDEKKNIIEAKAGDVIRGHLRIVVPKQRNFVSIEDYIPAGTELIDLNMSTADQSLQLDNNGPETPLEWERRWRDDNIKLWPDREERRDDKLYLFKQDLKPGVYEYDYYLRASVPGDYQHLPAVVRQLNFPENFGRSTGGEFVVVQ